MSKQNIQVLFLNCTLKRSPTESNTNVLIQKAIKLYEAQGATCEVVRVVDHNVKFGVTSDEGKGDEWPAILQKIKACDILIMASPIWFGVRSSVAQMVVERLDGTYMEGDKTTGQYPLYNKVAGVIVTGNEDGAHNVVAHTVGNLMHLGCTIPPNSDTYWVGEAGPGPSYIEAGQKHLYTNRTVRYMVANTLAVAKLLKTNPITTNLRELDKQAKQESE
ncbi:MAG: flavodoxin family protein [Candidatus Saccharimonadales bacterium]